jgi:AhpD family alkylhydroperoxidase
MLFEGVHAVTLSRAGSSCPQRRSKQSDRDKEIDMEARMKHPVYILQEAMPALEGLKKASQQGGVPESTLLLVTYRCSLLNGCAVCLDGEWRMMKAAGEKDERLFTVAGWRESPYFTPAERAALALAESTTNIQGGVSDEVWNEARKHYDEPQLAAILLTIASINVWNRLNIATRQTAGMWKPA